MHIRFTTPLIVLLFLNSLGSTLHAAQLWAVDMGTRATIPFVPIDIATGATSLAANIPTPQSADILDLASDPVRQPNLIWGVRRSLIYNHLGAINPFTEQLISDLPLDSSLPIQTLAIDPTNGSFYGATSSDLYVINKSTGVTKHVGPTTEHRGLGFDALGDLFAVTSTNAFVSVNKLTGATTVVASSGLAAIQDLAVDPDTNRMYGVASGSLFEIDTITGTITVVGNSLGRVAGMAFTDVPEPPTAILLFLAVCWSLMQTPRRRAPSNSIVNLIS
jgi:hypothetical protein